VLLRAATPLSQIAVGDLNGRSLVGYVTDFDPTTPWQKLTKPAEDGRLEPLRARIALRPFGADGARSALGEEQVLSLRAHSLGGLSLLTDAAAGKDALAVWTGLDKGEPQVFLTSVAADGKARPATHAHAQIGRSQRRCRPLGRRRLFGRLGGRTQWRRRSVQLTCQRALEKGGPEQRITTSDGAASQLTLTRVGGKPYAVWADARAAEEPGWADIYGAFSPSERRRTRRRRAPLEQYAPAFFLAADEPAGRHVGAGLARRKRRRTPASVRLATLSASGDITGNVSVRTDQGRRAARLGPFVPRRELPRGGDGRSRGTRRAARLRVASRHGAARHQAQQLGRSQRRRGRTARRDNFVYVADLRDGQGLVRRLGIEW
jgi:hypothetical protein